MKYHKLKSELKGVFKLPRRVYYFGKLKHGTPYFYPRGFHPTIIGIRKLRLRSPLDMIEWSERYPHLEGQPQNIYTNYPMVRRSKNRVVKIFGNAYFVTWGFPVSIKTTELGWKDKFDSPRFEWPPQFAIYFFGLQYIVWWNAPKLEGQKYANNDEYYEMILWYLHYSIGGIQEAKDTWPWADSDTKLSTWNDRYCVK